MKEKRICLDCRYWIDEKCVNKFSMHCNNGELWWPIDEGCEVCNGKLPVISYELPEYATKQEYLGDMSLIFIEGTDFKYCPYCGRNLKFLTTTYSCQT